MALTVVGSIAVGRVPLGIAISADGQHIYVSCPEDNVISVIDRATHQEVVAIPVGKMPEGMALSPNGTLYVCNTGDGSVSAVNSRSNTVTSSASVGQIPTRVATSPEGAGIYAISSRSASLASLDVKASRVLGTAGTETSPSAVAVSPDGRHIYVVAGSPAGHLSIYDSDTLIKRHTVALRGEPRDLAITPGGLKTYVCDAESSVSVIDNTTLKLTGAPIDVPVEPDRIVIHQDSLHAYVACAIAQTLVELDLVTDTAAQHISMNTPENLALSADGRQLFVVNVDAKTITVLNT